MKIVTIDSGIRLSSTGKTLFAAVLILVSIVSVYSNTFNASWHFDDGPNILNNKALHLTDLNWQDIKGTFFASWTGGRKLYRPVVCLSFALNYYFGGTNVTGYHVVNLTVHFIASLFLFLFIHNMLKLPSMRMKYGNSAYPIALLATVLWAINPVQIEAVTYVVQRMTSMAGMFYIMALYFYLKGRTAEQESVKNASFVLCLFCGVLSIGSKENAVMLPISILILDLILVQGISKRSIKKCFFHTLIALIAFLTVVLLIKGSYVLEPNKILSGYNIRGFTLFERLMTEPRVVLFYMSLLLYPLPSRLSFAHDISLSRSLVEPPTTLISILIILALIGLAVWKSKRWPLVSFCILFFFLNHAIESTVLPLELAFEHRNYIPSMLFFVPVALFIVENMKFFSTKPSIQRIILVGVILILIALGYSTYARNLTWKTDKTLWLDAVQKSPNLPRPHHNLGKYYDDVGLKRIALEHYRKALSLPEGPDRRSHFISSYNMGVIYKSFQDEENARRYLLKSVELEPRFSPAYVSIGIMSIEKGQNEDALNYFIKALTHDITSEQARNYAGLALLREERAQDAITQFKTTLATNPNDLYALTHIGVAYKSVGDLEKATAYLKKVLRIDSKYVTAFLHLIEVYSLSGQPEKATQTAEQLLKQFPDHVLPLLVDKRIINTEPLLAPPDLEIISPILEKALIKKGVRYHGLAQKLRKARMQGAEQ